MRGGIKMKPKLRKPRVLTWGDEKVLLWNWKFQKLAHNLFGDRPCQALICTEAAAGMGRFCDGLQTRMGSKCHDMSTRGYLLSTMYIQVWDMHAHQHPQLVSGDSNMVGSTPSCSSRPRAFGSYLLGTPQVDLLWSGRAQNLALEHCSVSE